MPQQDANLMGKSITECNALARVSCGTVVRCKTDEELLQEAVVGMLMYVCVIRSLDVCINDMHHFLPSIGWQKRKTDRPVCPMPRPQLRPVASKTSRPLWANEDCWRASLCVSETNGYRAA